MATLKKTKNVFQDRLSLNVGQKYGRMLPLDGRMLPLEHSAILSTFIKLPVVIKNFVLSIFEWVAVLQRFYCILISPIEYSYTLD